MTNAPIAPRNSRPAVALAPRVGCSGRPRRAIRGIAKRSRREKKEVFVNQWLNEGGADSWCPGVRTPGSPRFVQKLDRAVEKWDA